MPSASARVARQRRRGERHLLDDAQVRRVDERHHARHVVRDAELGGRDRERRRRRGDDEVARERDLARAAPYRALDHRDHGRWVLLDLANELRQRIVPAERIAAVGRQLARRRDRRTRPARPAARAGSTARAPCCAVSDASAAMISRHERRGQRIVLVGAARVMVPMASTRLYVRCRPWADSLRAVGGKSTRRRLKGRPGRRHFDALCPSTSRAPTRRRPTAISWTPIRTR